MRAEVACSGAVEADGEWKLDVTLLLCHLKKLKLVAVMVHFGSSGRCDLQLQQPCYWGEKKKMDEQLKENVFFVFF